MFHSEHKGRWGSEEIVTANHNDHHLTRRNVYVITSEPRHGVMMSRNVHGKGCVGPYVAGKENYG